MTTLNDQVRDGAAMIRGEWRRNGPCSAERLAELVIAAITPPATPAAGQVTVAVPHEAITAITHAAAGYEPEAVAALGARPGALLSALLEVSRRALEAAAPLIAAAERERCARLAGELWGSIFADRMREQP